MIQIFFLIIDSKSLYIFLFIVVSVLPFALSSFLASMSRALSQFQTPSPPYTLVAQSLSHPAPSSYSSILTLVVATKEILFSRSQSWVWNPVIDPELLSA